jgi:two-component system, NtrC family, response regulator HydG
MEDRLLLVDDNADFLDSTKDVLEDAGYNVMTASNGEDALSLFIMKAFDVVLMDIKMPGINGVETFIKMKEKNPDVNVVLFTAYSMNELIQKALKEGVCDVLSKPLDMSRLLRLVGEVKTKGKRGCVLIVDDDMVLCDNLHDVLDQSGYNVTASFDGIQALREVENESFDILILDMKLPGKNGLDIYREIKKIQPHLQTIIITGYAEEYSDLIKQAINENAYICIKKPVEIKSLLGILKKISSEKNQAG